MKKIKTQGIFSPSHIIDDLTYFCPTDDYDIALSLKEKLYQAFLDGFSASTVTNIIEEDKKEWIKKGLLKLKF